MPSPRGPDVLSVGLPGRRLRADPVGAEDEQSPGRTQRGLDRVVGVGDRRDAGPADAGRAPLLGGGGRRGTGAAAHPVLQELLDARQSADHGHRSGSTSSAAWRPRRPQVMTSRVTAGDYLYKSQDYGWPSRRTSSVSNFRRSPPSSGQGKARSEPNRLSTAAAVRGRSGVTWTRSTIGSNNTGAAAR